MILGTIRAECKNHFSPNFSLPNLVRNIFKNVKSFEICFKSKWINLRGLETMCCLILAHLSLRTVVYRILCSLQHCIYTV